MVVEKAGYRVLTATKPTHGLEVCKRESVDVAVVDYYMPEMNGDELCREMKRVNPAIPLILLSGVMIEEMSDCPDYVVVKGSGPRELLDKIAEVLTVRS